MIEASPDGACRGFPLNPRWFHKVRTPIPGLALASRALARRTGRFRPRRSRPTELLAPAAAPYLTLASYVSFDAQRFAEESWVVPSAARSSIVAVTSLPAWPASANV